MGAATPPRQICRQNGRPPYASRNPNSLSGPVLQTSLDGYHRVTLVRRESVDKALAKSVLNELGVGAHLHFLEQPRSVGTYGLFRKRQIAADFFHRLASRQGTQNFQLAIRKALVGRPRAVTAQTLCERLGERGANVGPSGQHLANRACQIFGRTVLVHVTGGTGTQRP